MIKWLHRKFHVWRWNRIEEKQCLPCWWYDKELGLCELHIDYIEKNCNVRTIECKEGET